MADQSEKRDPFEVTILFVTLSVPLKQLAARWAEVCDEIIIRRCPLCRQDSIVGHGRRRKQAHDEFHDWIWIRRGRCLLCRTTFTFLPLFSLPYTHFSMLARSGALWRRFQEHCSWEKAMPQLKSADRVPDGSTVRRWGMGLDGAQLADSFLRQMMDRVARWLRHGKQDDRNAMALPWIVSTLDGLWPLRL